MHRIPIAARVALVAAGLAVLLLTAGVFAVRAAVHATQLRATQQLATVEATQITDALQARVDLFGAFGSLPYQLVRSDGALIAAAPEAETVQLQPPSDEAPQTGGEVWQLDPPRALGARVAVSSTLRASSLINIAPSDLPGGPANKDKTVYRAYVLVTPTTADSAVNALDPFLWSGVVVAVGLIAATAGAATTRALRPVEHMRETAERISDAPDGTRLSVPEARDQLRALAGTLNAMLARIDDNAARQQRFAADAAHELRSPLTSLLAALEIARAHPTAVPAEHTLAHVETEAHRLANLTEELLTLAAAGGASPDADVITDVVTVVRKVVARMPVPVTVATPKTAPAQIAPHALERVLINLLDNAVRHAATGVWVDVHMDSDVHVRVANDGEMLSVDEAERIFRPFVRLDGSRSRDTGGTGLGLTIARELVTQYGGTLTASSEHARTTFTASLPRNADLRAR